jgi:hypothetical protein
MGGICRPRLFQKVKILREICFPACQCAAEREADTPAARSAADGEYGWPRLLQTEKTTDRVWII